METSLLTSEMANLSSFDLNTLSALGTTNKKATILVNDTNKAISSLIESVNLKNNITNAVTNQKTANLANNTKVAISSLIESVNSKNGFAYAIDGDSRYDEDMDADSDGIITYSEYIKYATKQSVEQYNLPKNSTTFSNLFDPESGTTKLQIVNMNKAFNSYITNSNILTKSLISKEA